MIMDNNIVIAGVTALIGILKGKDIWAFATTLIKSKSDKSKASKDSENELQKEIRNLFEQKITFLTDQIDSMKSRMIRIEDEREEYKERMIKAEAKVEALSERLTKYIHHSRGKKKSKKEED